MKHNLIKVSEIFGPTIQGEGALIGVPTVFVRTGGCDYRCSWCDTLYAVETQYRHEWTPMSAQAIFSKVEELSQNKPLTISLSGGNPAIQPLADLIKLGKDKNYKFTLETQGSIARDWFKDLDFLVLSPKPPSSEMSFDPIPLKECIDFAGDSTKVILKFVVFDEVDFEFAQNISKLFPHIPVYLQPGNHTPPQSNNDDYNIDQEGIMIRMRWLIDQAIEHHWYDVRILPQLHTIIWGNQRGV